MERRIKTLIVDDELEAREGLKLLLEPDQDISVIAACKNGIQAIEALTNFKIDLMFLDIQMPMVDGFEVVRSIPDNRLPAIIFVTAYDQYAVKAFEVHAIDYLLKPFSDERFYEAVNRAKEIIDRKERENQIKKLKKIAMDVEGDGHENILIDTDSIGVKNKLVVRESGKIHFINLEEIIWIEAFDYYVKIHLKEHFHTVRESMKRLIQRLPEKGFARIHKSSIINLNRIKSIKPFGNGEYQVELIHGIELKVSRGFKDSIIDYIP